MDRMCNGKLLKLADGGVFIDAGCYWKISHPACTKQLQDAELVQAGGEGVICQNPPPIVMDTFKKMLESCGGKKVWFYNYVQCALFSETGIIDRNTVPICFDSKEEKELKAKMRRPMEQAVYENKVGCLYAKDDQWYLALGFFSTAIRLNADIVTFFTNRALCYIQLSQKKGNLILQADADCNTALHLDPKCTKAFELLLVIRLAQNQPKCVELFLSGIEKRGLAKTYLPELHSKLDVIRDVLHDMNEAVPNQAQTMSLLHPALALIMEWGEIPTEPQPTCAAVANDETKYPELSYFKEVTKTLAKLRPLLSAIHPIDVFTPEKPYELMGIFNRLNISWNETRKQ